MSAINKNNLHRPPKSQAVADVQPRAGRFVFHTLSVVVMINGFLALNKMAFSKHIAPQYGGFWQFLTILGLLGSGIAFSVAALSDILPAIPTLKTIKRGIVIFAMPVEIVISSIYWPLVLFMPHLMLPPKQNDMSTGPEPTSSDDASLLFRIPLWMDLSMHAVPAVVLLFDFFFLEKRYKAPASTVYAPLVAITFGTAYSAWVEHCATMNDGKFPYPFLTVMPFSGRVIMYATSTLGALAVFWGLNKAHR